MLNGRPRFKLGGISPSKTGMKGTPKSHRKAQVKLRSWMLPCAWWRTVKQWAGWELSRSAK